MKIFEYPTPSLLKEILKRPVMSLNSVREQIRPVMEDVKNTGDRALFHYTKKLDGVAIDNLQVTDIEIARAESQISPELKKAIDVSIANLTLFHQAQKNPALEIETMPGVICSRRAIPIESVGLYIPSGTAALFSTVLMLAIPAKLAGCSEIVLCSPPDNNGEINTAILYCAAKTGVKKIFRVGGAQAIAAMAYGTESIPSVAKIFGPGNQYVTAAKQLVSLENTAIDLPAGPSEVAVIADEKANPVFVATDLLSQAEHGSDSQVVLITWNRELADNVLHEVSLILEELPRKETARKALQHARIIIVKNEKEAINVSNQYAPEHLIINTADPHKLADKVVNAGSVFIGAWTPEAAGDYASGTNHTLPTNGFARNYSGVSLDSFYRQVTFQEISPEGLSLLGPSIEIMAEAESLRGHRLAVSKRLNVIKGEKNV